MGIAATTSRQDVTDDALVKAAHAADMNALQELLDRHLHPAWRIALVAAPDAATAERAVVDGFCDGLGAAHRHPDVTLALRERIVATTRRHAVEAGGSGLGRRNPTPGEDPVLAAFLVLPEAWRTAVWLSEVEGGTPEQVAKVLGLDRNAAAALTDRATAGLRDRIAADVADRADDPDCRRALKKLPALAAGKLTAKDREIAGAHFASCGSCSLWLAALVAPRPALRRLVVPLSAGLVPAIADRWAELLERERKAWLAPWTERAIGAAAAAVLAVGLAGVALLGGRDRGRTDDTEQLAIPSGSVESNPPSSGEGESAAGAPPGASGQSTGTSGGTATGSTSGGSGTRSGSSGTPSTTSTSLPAKLSTPSSPTTQPQPTTTTTPPGTPDTPGPDTQTPEDTPPPPTDNPIPQVSVGVGGTVEVGVGECTGVTVAGIVVGCDPETTAPLNIVVDLPGLPPLVL